MWTIVEAREAAKTIDKLPRQVAERYALWCAIVRQSGPAGLRLIKSFHDEKLSGTACALAVVSAQPTVARYLPRAR